MDDKFDVQQDLFFLITLKRFTLKIFFLGIQLWPTWFRTNTYGRRKGHQVHVGPNCMGQERYWLCTMTIQWLIFEMVIPYWEMTEAGRMYPKGYLYYNDPNYEDKLKVYQYED